jgi:hypothetical protein
MVFSAAQIDHRGGTPRHTGHHAAHEDPIDPGLGQIGYGVLLVSTQGELLSANGPARLALDEGLFIGLTHGQLTAVAPGHASELAWAITEAGAGRMQKLVLSRDGAQLRLACLPLGQPMARLVQPVDRAGVLIVLHPVE